MFPTHRQGIIAISFDRNVVFDADRKILGEVVRGYRRYQAIVGKVLGDYLDQAAAMAAVERELAASSLPSSAPERQPE